MKKILILSLYLMSFIGYSKYVEEGTYNGIREKKVFLRSYNTDNGLKYFLVALNGYVHATVFETEERLSKIQEGEIVEFVLDEHYKDFIGNSDDYKCDLKVAFTNNGNLLLDTENYCSNADLKASGEYKYSEKDSKIPVKYHNRWENKEAVEGCAYISEKSFASDIYYGNYVLGVEELTNGELLLDGLLIYEGFPSRNQFKYKFLSNGNVSITEYNGSVDDKIEKSYNNLKKLSSKEKYCKISD